MQQKLAHILSLIYLMTLLIQSSFGQSDQCLKCICKGTTGCTPDRGCKHGACGPYAITQPFWADAGKLTAFQSDSKDENSLFLTCVKDEKCAKKTLTSWFEKNQKDCNGDGVVSCFDYATLYQLGTDCEGKKLNFEYQRKIKECIANIHE